MQLMSWTIWLKNAIFNISATAAPIIYESNGQLLLIAVLGCHILSLKVVVWKPDEYWTFGSGKKPYS